MVRNDIKNSSLLKTKFLIYAFNGRTFFLPLAKVLENGFITFVFMLFPLFFVGFQIYFLDCCSAKLSYFS